MSSTKNCIRIHPHDSVAVALVPLAKGTVVTIPAAADDRETLTVTVADDIPAGHKFALKAIAAGEPVIKYGYPIGAASRDIAAGNHVHTHNVKTLLAESAAYTYDEERARAASAAWKADTAALGAHVPTVNAYRRADGKIGIRNEIWIVPTVGCVNKIAESLAQWGNGEFCGGKPGPAERGGIEGVFAWTHPYGCSQMGEDHEKTRTILADLVRHPNAGAVLVLGLGCENNTVAQFKQTIGDYDENRVKFLIAQESADEIADGQAVLKELARFAGQYEREPVPASELVVGMKCGGSDGLSGITANALVGRACDALSAVGASVMLTEVPEMFGAERILMDRCENRAVFDETVRLINGFKDYYVRHGQVVYENPSPGNKAGGITTLEDKSLGCVQKGGKAPVRGVLRYGEQIAKKGLNLLEGPGNDIVSTTAMTAAGAHLILFTTGRGTPLGAPVPTVKIATNHPLAAGKPGWIDFDAAALLDGNADAVRDELLELIYDIASGKIRTKNETNGYREIAIFKEGVTL
ncbi:UxaA family hydrolase [Treponema brennaborense]|uniref:Altronate dehydratase n=1 Tax=Treponema brennaborense (strain DSM 12168 / CIP 105900 / DD5/3) TaxID=906968 RepID=F4LK89_TREBD|nr:altronate dehydratase family protein [Treponema brennaborense]AEE15478.1 Altronate dehydratase [Treponema brennaborense DSM 12168]